MRSAEIRILGCLLEKDITTPEYYPLTLNALQNASNQKSSRDPVVNYDEETVSTALESLQHKDRLLQLRCTPAIVPRPHCRFAPS